MLDIYSRHRPFALLAAVVLCQVLLLAFQIKREHDVRLIRYWAVELMTPVERAGTWTFSKVGGVWSGYVDLRAAHSENETLKTDLDQLRIRNRDLETQAAEAQRLELLLNFRDAHSSVPMLAAQVIGASADPTSHTLFLNRGERDHVRRNQAVITPDGAVGKIVEVFPSASQVLLINDREGAVGALFLVSRTQGIVKGMGDSDPRMDYVSNDEKVQPGDQIVTSGLDRIFPKGIPIGTVESAAPGNPFQIIKVKPAVRLDRLEDVLILLSMQEIQMKKEPAVAAASEGASQPPAAESSAGPSQKSSSSESANSHKSASQTAVSKPRPAHPQASPSSPSQPPPNPPPAAQPAASPN
ncbi:MAG TPA: rod shape-determining protein MreC [Verrucomicrobiae bacterium]|nr:rod shape-determining protein MreC [Verrucomicrobiae bacterium]